MISHIFNLKKSESRMLYNEIIANCKNDDQWPLVFGDFKVTKEIISLTPENRRICKKINELFVSGCHLLPILGVFYNNVSFVDAKIMY